MRLTYAGRVVATCATAALAFALGASIDDAPWNQTPPPAHAASAVGPDVDCWSDASCLLARVLPYWNVDAPGWCQEDQACWIGSRADGRTPEQIVADLPCDLLISTVSYAEADPRIDADPDIAACSH